MAHLEEKFEGGVLTLTMNRPEARNAMSGEMMQLLEEAIPRAADDPEVRCLVLTGAGGAFCSGGDQSVRGKAGYVGGDGVPRLNVLDLQKLQHPLLEYLLPL